MNYILIFVSIASMLFGINKEASVATPKKILDNINSELKHAETWSLIARATNNSIDYHNYSKIHYENIKNLALTLLF